MYGKIPGYYLIYSVATFPWEIFFIWWILLFFHPTFLVVILHRGCPNSLLPFRAQVETQGPRAKSGPPPRFIQPGTLFLLSGSAELSLNC